MRIISIMKKGFGIARRMDVAFSYNCFRQVCSMAVIIKHLGALKDKKGKIFFVIGDGYGFLGALIKYLYPDSSVVLVDIGKTLLFQAFYCQKAFPSHSHAMVGDPVDAADFLYCPAERLGELSGLRFDIAINIASMQEMTKDMIKIYFQFLRQSCLPDNLFYCCNRESKTLPSGEALEIKKYPWDSKDRNIIDEYCPWYKFYLSFKPAKKKAKVLGVGIPFITYFSGPVIHRLTILAKSDDLKHSDS